jgi:hypothetical protein
MRAVEITVSNEFSNIQKEDVRRYVDSLHAKGTPWADGCAAVLVALWAEVDHYRERSARPEERLTTAARRVLKYSAPSRSIEGVCIVNEDAMEELRQAIGSTGPQKDER